MRDLCFLHPVQKFPPRARSLDVSVLNKHGSLLQLFLRKYIGAFFGYHLGDACIWGSGLPLHGPLQKEDLNHPVNDPAPAIFIPVQYIIYNISSLPYLVEITIQ